MKKFPFYLVSTLWLLSIFNPVFKKYDYGAGLPMAVLLALSVLAILIFLWAQKREKLSLEGVFLLGYFFLLSISFLYSSTLGVGFSEYLALAAASLLYLVLAYVEIPWIPQFIKVIRWAVLASILIGVLVFLTFDEVRMIGPFFNKLNHAHTWPNAFALFLLMTWPLFILEKRRWILGIVLAALILTFSRGAILVFGGQLLIMAIFFRQRIEWKQVALVGLIALTLFFGLNGIRSIYYPVVEVEEKLSQTDDEAELSTSDRFTFWRGALDLIEERPLIGWGPFSFRYAYSGIQDSLLETADHPHNVFLKIGAESGLVALFAFLGFLAIGGVNLLKNFKKLGAKKDLVLILSVSVAGAFAHNLIDYNLNFIATLMLLFLFLAFIRSLIGGERKEKKPKLLLFLSLIIATSAGYEASVQALKLVLPGSKFLNYSLYPRTHYLESKDYQRAIWWNSLDADAYFEKGDYLRAIELNPLNDFRYYVAYVRGGDPDLGKIVTMLEKYFVFVENNTHFTAYSGNVEAAAELVDLIALRDPKYQYLLLKKEKMLAAAEHARNNKSL